MSSFESIVEETKLDGEIEAAEFILNNFLSDYCLGTDTKPTDISKVRWLVRGYILELMDLKHDQ